MHLARANEVIIIQHQDDVFRHIGQIVDEQSDQGIEGWESWCLEQAGYGPERIGKDGLQGSGERVHEDAQLVVVFIKGEPGRGAIDRLHPLRPAVSSCQSPAGAHTSVTLPLSPAFKRSRRRARGIRSLPLRGR